MPDWQTNELAALQAIRRVGSGANDAGDAVVGLFQENEVIRQQDTLGYLESQLAACVQLKSTKEYLYWLRLYVARLAELGEETRLEAVCEDLANGDGRVFGAAILGLDSSKLLQQEVLPAMNKVRSSQRLAQRYNRYVLASGRK